MVLTIYLFQALNLSSWHARAAGIKLLQVSVFSNLFLLQDPRISNIIRRMVMTRLKDVQVEIREIAAVTLSGFIHCGYLTMDEKLLVDITEKKILKKHLKL